MRMTFGRMALCAGLYILYGILSIAKTIQTVENDRVEIAVQNVGVKLELGEQFIANMQEIESVDRTMIDEKSLRNTSEKIYRIFLSEEEKERRETELQPIMDEISKKYGATGVSVALIENGELAGTWQYGYAVKNAIKMDEDTKIRIASISKVILAMNVLRLAEQNIVNLDESISAYWGFPIANPNYPDKLITLRSILTHTSSIADLEVKNVEYKLRNNVVFRNVEPSSASAWSYCNFAFGVAGATLEKAAGKSIFEISKENFFEPMNIDVAFAPGRLQNKEQLASLYYAGGSLARSKEEMYYYMGSDIPSNNAAYMMGGVCTSAQDLAKLISILINDGVYQGERYLSEESVVAMETRYCDGSQHGVKFEQCMPLDYTSNIYGEDGLYFHTGSAYGVYALISYNPNNKNGVVVITTGASGVCDGHGIYAVCGEIAEFLYNEGRKNIIKHGGL